MIAYLLLVPYAVVLGVHALVAFALPQELAERHLTLAAIAGPMLCYLGGSVGALVATGAATVRAPWATPLAIVAALAIVVGPLWYGRIVGEFHLSHHLVRGTLVAVSLVLFLTYVCTHR